MSRKDLESLLEKAKEIFTEEKAKDMQEKFLKGEFNLVDLYETLNLNLLRVNRVDSFFKNYQVYPNINNLNI